MAEIKRGYPITDLQVMKEAKQIGPYPPWEAWKPSFRDYLRKAGIANNFGPDVEEMFHEWYVFRRREQLEEIESRDADKFREEFNARNGEILEDENIVKALKFITQATAKKLH